MTEPDSANQPKITVRDAVGEDMPFFERLFFARAERNLRRSAGMHNSSKLF